MELSKEKQQTWHALTKPVNLGKLENAVDVFLEHCETRQFYGHYKRDVMDDLKYIIREFLKDAYVDINHSFEHDEMDFRILYDGEIFRLRVSMFHIDGMTPKIRGDVCR